MKQSEQRASAVTDRRNVLKLAAAGVVTSGAAIAAGPATAAPTPEAGSDGLYRETAHVKRYYDLARL